ncbi:hypothetical protein Tco_1361010 [Tanacetum coccineum]
MFDKAFKRVNTFEDFRTELVEGKEKRVGTELIQENAKKQKVEDDKETAELKQCLEIILDKEEKTIDAIPLAVKFPSIVGWKIHKEGRKNYYQIMRADGKSQMYMIFSHMLKSFNREDLEDLYKGLTPSCSARRLVEYFCVHISQLVPISVNCATIFEVYCRALGMVPTIPLFRVFYKLYKFFLVDRRAAPIAMALWHHDASVAVPFPKPSEYNEQDAARLGEIAIPLHKPYNMLTMAEFLRLPDLHGCKVAAGALLPPGAVLKTHLTTLSTRLEDVLAKTGAMEMVEVPCRKVLADKEKKNRKAEVKAAAKADDHDDIHIERVASNKCAGGMGAPRKKRKTCVDTPLVNADSEHVSSPTPINQSLSVVAPANEKHVSKTASAAQLAALQNQTDGQGSPLDLVNKNVEELVAGKGRGDDHDNVNVAIEGHGDNADGLFGLRTQPSPNNNSRPRIESVKKPMCDKQLPDTEAGILATYLSLPNEDILILAQQANVILCFEALIEEHDDLVHAHKSCKDVKARYKECKKELEKALKQSEEDAHQLRLVREKFVVECGNGEMVRRRIINEYLPTFAHQLYQSAEYKWSLGEVFSLAIGKGFIDGISVGQKDEDVQTILKATLGVNPMYSSTFMEEYNKLFDKRYPYVDKVARSYLLDPTDLHNVMPNETGSTPGQGPRDTPMASYA